MSNSSKYVMAGALAALPLLSVAPNVHAQSGVTFGREKLKGTTKTQGDFNLAHRFSMEIDGVSVAGVHNNQVVFERSDGRHFWVDPATGDLHYIEASTYLKYGAFKNTIKSGGMLKSDLKFDQAYKASHRAVNLKIIGAAQDGNTVMQNSSGQKFVVDPTTGDFVYLH